MSTMIFSNKQRMSNFPSSEALCQNECGLALHSHTCVTENLETEPSPLLICEIIRGTEDGAQRGKREGLTMGEGMLSSHQRVTLHLRPPCHSHSWKNQQ